MKDLSVYVLSKYIAFDSAEWRYEIQGIPKCDRITLRNYEDSYRCRRILSPGNIPIHPKPQKVYAIQAD